MKSVIRELDVMRALAIFIIIFHHLPDFSFNFYNFKNIGINVDLSFLKDLNRYFGLGIFVFLSGYLLELTNPNIKCFAEVKTFLYKRIARIFPLYIIAFIVFVLLFRNTIENFTIFSICAHIFGLQIILSSKYCDTIFTLWYVGLIMAYYYSYALWRLININKTRYLVIYYMFISLVWLGVKSTIDIGDQRFVLYLPILVFGIIFAKEKILERIDIKIVSFAVLAILISACIYIIFVYPKTVLHFPIKPSLLSFPSLAAMVLTNIIMASFVIITYYLSRHLTPPTFYSKIAKISYASFCMYLFHRPILYGLLQIFNPANIFIKTGYLILIGVPIVVFISFFIQKMMDLLVNRGLAPGKVA
ncbi:MAG: acyltransferase family protein [Candidatus Pacebacteria bacterium]|nr:acyltransferase family protein [Candidatus Paceibacterota bacterium]